MEMIMPISCIPVKIHGGTLLVYALAKGRHREEWLYDLPRGCWWSVRKLLPCF